MKILCFLSIFGLLTAATRSSTERMSKKEAIGFLRSYAEANQKQLTELDGQLREALMKTYNTDLSPQLGPKKEMALAREIEFLTLKRKEHKLRSDFIDRLTFNIDRKYKSGNWKDFLSQQIIEMASIEATSLASDVGMVKFCGFLSAAVKKIPEKSEDIFSFIEGYIEFSTLLDPRPPSEYVRHRSYTNGSQSVYKEGIGRENLGDIVEERLARLTYLQSLQRKSFEDRAPIMKPLDLTVEVPELTPAESDQEITEAKLGRKEGGSPLAEEVNPAGIGMRIELKQIHKMPSKGPFSEDPGDASPKNSNYEQAL